RRPLCGFFVTHPLKVGIRGRDDIGMNDLGVRLASIPAGVRVTLIACAAAAFDVQVYAAASRRSALFAVLGLGALGTLAIGRLPWARIVRGRWRGHAFLA